MDDMITTALRERAEGDIHVERLLGAVRAGVRRQRRRRFAIGCGVSATVAALVAVAGLAVVPGRAPDTIGAPPPAAGFPRPPVAGSAPTAADVPEVLGSDPALFHLDLFDMSGWRYVSWAASSKYEEMTVQASESGGNASVSASRDPQWLGVWGEGAVPATVSGLPAQIRAQFGSHAVRWQPRPGIWAQVQASGPPDIAIGVAEKLRLDRVYRCAVPFRLTGLGPPRTLKCSTDFTLDDDGMTATAAGSAWVTTTDGGPEYQISVGRSRDRVVVNDMIAGKPVQVSPASADGSTPPEIRYAFDGSVAYFWQHGAGPPEAFRAVVAAFTPVPGRDPASWPTQPMGP
jgi:hypothetical protein